METSGKGAQVHSGDVRKYWKDVYYEEIKREIKRILIHECRCHERLRVTAEGSTRLGDTGTGTPKDTDEIKRREVCEVEITYFFIMKRWSETLWEVHRILTHGCRCDERCKPEGCTRLGYTGLSGGLEPLKIDTRLRYERFESVMGECVLILKDVKVFVTFCV